MLNHRKSPFSGVKSPCSYGFPMVYQHFPMEIQHFSPFSYGFPMVFPIINEDGPFSSQGLESPPPL
jgi:hypothetical protein